MRILVVTNLYPPDAQGGYELGCQEVVDGLRRRGHDVHVVTRRSPIDAAAGVDRSLHHRRGGDRRLIVTAPFLAILDARTIRRVGRSFRPDVVYIWNPVGLSRAAIATATRLAPTAVYVAGSWLEHAQAGSAFPDPYVHQACRLLGQVLASQMLASSYAFLSGMSRVTEWHFDSSYLRESAEARLAGDARGATIYHAVAVDDFLPVGQGRSSFGGPRVLFVGRIVPKKGVDLALEAFKLAQAEVPEATFSIVGDGSVPYRAELRELAVRLSIEDSVHWVGPKSRTDLRHVYAAHDVFLFLTEEEAFGIALVEAAAAGLVVVSSGVGGTPEATPCGEVAVCVGTTDPRAAAAAVVAGIRGGRETSERVLRGLAHVRNFHADVIAHETELRLAALAMM